MTNILPQPDYDARWKDLIRRLPWHFLLKFFPNIHRQANRKKRIRFLDKELQKLLADFEKKGVRTGDLLMEVPLKGGGRRLVLIHVEAQHAYDATLPERMFATFYRLRERHPDTPLTAIAIYTGEDVPAAHDRFSYQFEGAELTYKFNAFVVRSQQEREQELLRSKNPVDLAVLAALYALNSKGDVQKAFSFKRKLARLCFERGWDKPSISILITFVTYLIALPEQEENIYEQEVVELLNPPAMTQAREANPTAARTVDMLFLGKPLEEWLKERDQKRDEKRDLKRDRERKKMELEKNKKLILSHYQIGIKPALIAQVLEVELRFVNATIRNFMAAQKAASGSQPNS